METEYITPFQLATSDVPVFIMQTNWGCSRQNDADSNEKTLAQMDEGFLVGLEGFEPSTS